MGIKVSEALEMCSVVDEYTIQLPEGLSANTSERLATLFEMKGGKYNAQSNSYKFLLSQGERWISNLLNKLIEKYSKIESQEDVIDSTSSVEEGVPFPVESQETPEETEEEPETFDQLPEDICLKLVKLVGINQLSDADSKKVIYIPDANKGEIINAIMAFLRPEVALDASKIIICYTDPSEENRGFLSEKYGEFKNFGDLLKSGFTELSQILTKDMGGQEGKCMKSNMIGRIILGYDQITDPTSIKHAFGLLKEGGRLVAFAGESFFSTDPDAVDEFYQWLEDVPEYFQNVEVGDGVAIVIDK